MENPNEKCVVSFVAIRDSDETDNKRERMKNDSKALSLTNFSHASIT